MPLALLTKVIPGMFMNKSSCVEQFMYRNHQPVAKALVVHEKHLLAALHTYLA